MSVRIVYETHSISEDNERGIATGWRPGRLSEAGRRLAAEFGERRRDDGIDVVFTSDLRRAVETAEIAFADGRVAVRTDARLRECDYGALNGMPVERLDAERLSRIDEPFPDGESYRQVAERMRTFLDDLRDGCDAHRVLLVGHAATRFSLDHLLHGVPLEDLVCAPFHWQPGWEYVLP